MRGAIDLQLGDIRDARFVEGLCDKVELVFHLAALISIPYSYAAPASYIETNVTGTLNLLEAARRAGCRRFIHTSTSEVYGTPEMVPIRETHPLNAQSPYAASKIGADQLVLSFQRSFGTPAVVLRPFNTYGPRQSTRAVLPTILTQLLQGKRRDRARSPGSAARPDLRVRHRRRVRQGGGGPRGGGRDHPARHGRGAVGG